MSYDITLCGGGDCPLKHFCYRNTAEVLGRQNFFGSMPFDMTTKSCEFFIKNEAYFKEIRERAYFLWKSGKLSDGNAVEYWQEAERRFFDEIV
ncbi:MAG: DUF2934 domain-containing protein [Spirosomataceae bacterium]|jgi:hypothetical protein